MLSMRILYLASVRVPSEKASGLAIVRQCSAFAELGHEVELLHQRLKNSISEDPFTYYGIVKKFKTKSLPVIPFFYRSLRILGFALTRFSTMAVFTWYLWKKRNEVDLVYSRDQWLLLLPILFFRSPIIWEAHTKHIDIVTRFVLRRVTKVVVISNGLKEVYEELGGRIDLLVAPSGVDVEQFSNVWSRQSELRKKLGIPISAKVVGYIGKYTTMGESKGVDELVKAFVKVAHDVDRVYLLIVGLEEWELQSFEEKCRAFGIPREKIGLHPLEQKRFAEYVMSADVVVANYPSTKHYRNFMSPTKLFAYLAGRRIVIASDLPSVRSMVGDAVVYVEPGNIESLTVVLTEVLQNMDKYEPLYKNVDLEQYSWERRGEKILKKITCLAEVHE